MSVSHKLRRKINDPLGSFKALERTIAVVCIFIPAVLRIADTDPDPNGILGFRSSISSYVYMPHSYIFGVLLCMAAMLFVFNGAVYLQNEEPHRLELNTSGKWYNLVLGISLMLVVILPCREYIIAHDISAGFFFLGNALVIGLFHEKKNRVLSITLAVLTVLSLVPWAAGFSALFWSEWLSMIVIGIHFLLEASK
jgi:branched-subunit amino acid transport protein AzlD